MLCVSFVAVCPDDFCNQFVADHICFIEDDKINSRNIFFFFLSLHQARLLMTGKVNLRDITCDEEFGGPAHTCQEHLQLA